jgi:hypothetical protein
MLGEAFAQSCELLWWPAVGLGVGHLSTHSRTQPRNRLNGDVVRGLNASSKHAQLLWMVLTQLLHCKILFKVYASSNPNAQNQ